MCSTPLALSVTRVGKTITAHPPTQSVSQSTQYTNVGAPVTDPLSCKLKTVSMDASAMGCFEVSGDVAGTMCDLPVFPAVGWYRGFSLQNKQRKVCEGVCVCVPIRFSVAWDCGDCHKQMPFCIEQAYQCTHLCLHLACVTSSIYRGYFQHLMFT